MSGELSRFLHLLSTAVDAQDGATVAKLLSFQNAPSVRAVSESLRVNPKLNLVSLCEQRLREPMDEVMVSHCQYLFAFAQERYADAYAALVAATTAFLKEFRSADTPWPNPVLQGLTYELRVVAMKADEQLKAAGKKAEKLGDAGSQLMKCFSTALQATNHKGKRMVTLHIVVQLFKIYFKLNTLRLCKNLIKAVDAPTYVPFGQFPQSQKVRPLMVSGHVIHRRLSPDVRRLASTIRRAQLCSRLRIRNELSFVVQVCSFSHPAHLGPRTW
eukprot:jgi/Mesvir1/7010/Mv09142-RA.1